MTVLWGLVKDPTVRNMARCIVGLCVLAMIWFVASFPARYISDKVILYAHYGPTRVHAEGLRVLSYNHDRFIISNEDVLPMEYRLRTMVEAIFLLPIAGIVMLAVGYVLRRCFPAAYRELLSVEVRHW